MKEIYLQKRLDMVVPSSIIDAIWDIYNFYQKHINKSANLTWAGTDIISVSELQTYPGIEKYNKKQIQNFKLRNQWIFTNEQVLLVDKFLKENFNSFFQFRINCMKANTILGWHDKHPYPRIFIPLHDNNAIFQSKNKEQKIVNSFKLGECWLWDVRQLHGVNNIDSADRIMACFNIDPLIESNPQIFL